ncbi:hypothetical protein [Candidatus Alkanophaga liquidiphilum]
MEVTKTVKCKIIGLTGRKRELLDREYDNFQHWLERVRIGEYIQHTSKMQSGYIRKQRR